MGDEYHFSEVPRPRRVGVTGGRDFNDWDAVEMAFDLWVECEDVIVHGAARGADTLCMMVAAARGNTIEVHPADWYLYGKSAGPRRNQEMVDSHLDILIAFPGGRGTADMVRRCHDAGVLVKMVRRVREERLDTAIHSS